MYHERQRWAFCGVHAINNLLQTHRYDKTDFDQICQELAPDVWINPHKSILGVGNYDVNVLMVLLEQRLDMEVKWQDNRSALQFDSDILGIVVNLPSTSFLARYITKGRHWLTLLWKDGVWINLDSDLKEPQVIGDREACIKLLDEWRSEKECHILLVKEGNNDEQQKGDGEG